MTNPASDDEIDWDLVGESCTHDVVKKPDGSRESKWCGKSF